MRPRNRVKNIFMFRSRSRALKKSVAAGGFLVVLRCLVILMAIPIDKELTSIGPPIGQNNRADFK